MAQPLKVLVAKPDNLSSVLRARVLEGENLTPTGCPVTSTCVPPP